MTAKQRARLCKPFRDWLSTDRKTKPPCDDCSQIYSTLERAAVARKRADDLEAAAELRLTQAHGKD